MLTFLFWNINGKPLERTIRRLVVRHAVDVLILAECGIEPARMLTVLNANGQGGTYTFWLSEGRRVHIYTRLPSDAVQPLFDGPHFSARRLRPLSGDEVLLIAAHRRSKLYQRSESQQLACVDFARDVRELEERIGHRRTVLVGDLNMDPFEPGVVAANGLHAVASKQVALQGTREVDGRAYPFFYNPMWACLGERDASPPGTYHFRRAEHLCYFWHVLDQVLIRPALVDLFVTESLAVLVSDGQQSLLRANRDGVRVPHPSDHLPVLFSLRLQEEEDTDVRDR